MLALAVLVFYGMGCNDNGGKSPLGDGYRLPLGSGDVADNGVPETGEGGGSDVGIGWVCGETPVDAELCGCNRLFPTGRSANGLKLIGTTWKLIEFAQSGTTIDYSEKNIIYDFHENGSTLIVSGLGSLMLDKLTDGEHFYYFDDDDFWYGCLCGPVTNLYVDESATAILNAEGTYCSDSYNEGCYSAVLECDGTMTVEWRYSPGHWVGTFVKTNRVSHPSSIRDSPRTLTSHR
jgi:hypothetical protein